MVEEKIGLLDRTRKLKTPRCLYSETSSENVCGLPDRSSWLDSYFAFIRHGCSCSSCFAFQTVHYSNYIFKKTHLGADSVAFPRTRSSISCSSGSRESMIEIIISISASRSS